MVPIYIKTQQHAGTITRMLVYIADYLSQYYSGFNVFQYLTLRAILGVLTALLISFLVGPGMIRRLGRYQIGQQVRNEGHGF